MSLALPHIAGMRRYPAGVAPADPERSVKLNQNESPYPPSPKVLKALQETGGDSLRRYPDAASTELRRALASRYGVSEGQVFCGNGSSEIISLIMKVFVGAGGRVALPDPSFDYYHTAAVCQQVEVLPVPTGGDFEIDTEGLLSSGADAVVLINPHAPTGRLLGREEIRRLADGFHGLVVVDEAYMEYAKERESAAALLKICPNLLVLRTFSKAYGLCGARIGYALTAPESVEALEKGKDLYNLNAVSAKLALAALSDPEYTAQTVQAVIRTREAFIGRLEERGFTVHPSWTNFVLCSPPSGPGRPDASRLQTLLQERGIYVRYLEHPRLADKLRISIGTDSEMERLLEELDALR
ncbi:histidinol-phosphate transaminase [Gorillibacterium sp. sgz5001074]|uniref:histidinol-phosphate transaminase n=1 Tax=Gorillibacterium sp. sgz5001074 TaxID=3446695 RepID=UPI003F66F356